MENPTRLKPSTAIRLGALLRPHALNSIVEADGSVCAMGAAYLAVKGRAPQSDIGYSEVYSVFPEFDNEELKHTIWRINRDSGREAVAEYLESLGM